MQGIASLFSHRAFDHDKTIIVSTGGQPIAVGFSLQYLSRGTPAEHAKQSAVNAVQHIWPPGVPGASLLTGTGSGQPAVWRMYWQFHTSHNPSPSVLTNVKPSSCRNPSDPSQNGHSLAPHPHHWFLHQRLSTPTGHPTRTWLAKLSSCLTTENTLCRRRCWRCTLRTVSPGRKLVDKVDRRRHKQGGNGLGTHHQHRGNAQYQL